MKIMKKRRNIERDEITTFWVDRERNRNRTFLDADNSKQEKQERKNII